MDMIPINLTPTRLRKFAENISALKNILEDKEKLYLFFNRFPFENFLNITLIDGDAVLSSTKIIDLFCDYEEFYTYSEAFHNVLEFILINLSNVNKDCEEILLLLKLLSKILDRKPTTSSFKSIFDRDRILEVMLKMTNFKVVQKSNFISYTPLLTHLLDSESSESVKGIVSELFNSLKKQNAVGELVDICRLSLKNRNSFLSINFANLRKWIIDESSHILLESSNYSVIMGLLDCLAVFSEHKFELCNSIQGFYKNLSKAASRICEFACDCQLRKNALKLLEFMLDQFYDEEKLSDYIKHDVSNDLNALPLVLEQWPRSDCFIFFNICHLCILYSRPSWTSCDIIQCIQKYFYNCGFYVNCCFLKSIYFLYPVLTEDMQIDDYYLVSLGKDLISDFVKFSMIGCMYSYNGVQLKWLLRSSSKNTKSTILKQWINQIEIDESLEEILTRVISDGNFETDLLALILDYNTNQDVGLKVAGILRKIKTDEISRKVALCLPLRVDKPEIFSNLILAEPGITLDFGDRILICSVMGAIIPSLDDAQVLKGACVFSSKLIASCKNEPEAVKSFCRNINNIRHLVDTVDAVDDDVGIEIIRLLRVIVLTQRQNKIIFEEHLTEDFNTFLKGSSEKIEKSLKLIYHIIPYKHSIIRLEASYVFALYRKILDFGLDLKLQAYTYECVVVLLKRFSWLAETTTSSCHIEMACLAAFSPEGNANVFRLLDVWLMMLGREPNLGFSFIPEAAIKSFVFRALPDRRNAEEYLKILENLHKNELRDESDVFIQP